MTNLIPIDDIRKTLQDRRLTVVAERCGLSHPTVKSIATGNEQISLTTWKKLSEYLSDSQ
ncbi:helix-turn-helix transcriptional regulator [Roseobacter phage CRP-901]|nr:helix-turn-helix transcriptional regulator [Roseobacter phage CRP-901]